jgi:hypothetical protein
MPGPVHATVTPYVLLLPNKLIVGLVQLITVSTPAFAFGDTVSIPTTTASVDVQPLIGCVAVTVYVVGTDTFVTAVFAPFDHANVAPDVDLNLLTSLSSFLHSLLLYRYLHLPLGYCIHTHYYCITHGTAVD